MRKSLLKTVVATAIVGAVMAVSSFVAMAATNTYYYVEEETKINTDDFFTVNGGGASGSSLTTSFSFSGETDTYTPKTNIKMDSNGSVKFTTSGTATVEIIYGLRTNQTAATVLALDGEQFSTTDITNYVTKTFTGVASGSHEINRPSGKEGRIYGIKVVDVVSDSAKEYTVSGSTNLANATFTVGDESVTTDKNGNWSISKTAETSPFTVGDTLAVSMNGYSAEPSSVTLKAGSDEYNFTASSITFTEKELEPIASGEYKPADIEAGLPNFDIKDLVVNSTGKYKTSSLKFKLSDPATVIVNGKSGSSTEGRDAVFKIGDESYTKLAGEAASNLFFSCPAGETVLELSENNTTAQIVSITIAYGIADTLHASSKGTDYYCISKDATYIIHPVSDKEMEYAKLAMADSDGVAIDATSTDSAYTSVVFSDQSEVTASSCGAAYIYAIQVTGTDGSAPTQKYKWVEVGGAE